MTPSAQQRALRLWQRFAQDAAALDEQAIEALLLRDDLAQAELTPESLEQVCAIDKEVQNRAQVIVEQLKRSTMIASVQWWREKGDAPRRTWWWWLDAASIHVPASSLS